jgi:signal peptidase I
MMKSNDKKIVLILIAFILSTLFNFFVFKYLKINTIYYVLYWLFFLILSIALLGYNKDRSLYRIDVVQIVFIYSFIYLIITYLLGLLFGYTRSPYSLTFINIFFNILPVLAVIVIRELFRYVIVSKSNKIGEYFLLIITFVTIDITFNLGSYDLKSVMGIFSLVGNLIIPSIVNNLLLTYLVKKAGYLPTLVYQLIFGLYIYLVPVFPDFGAYFEALFNVVFPTILFVKLNTIMAKPEYRAYKANRFTSILISIPLVGVLCFVVSLVSGVFTYYAMAVGSESMVPTLDKGDAVIVRKLTKDDLDSLQIGDIIVYEHDNKLIVHRLVAIKKAYGATVYNTKGDNNNAQDAWDINSADIKGLVRYNIKYIGYPSVWLTEALK